MNDTIDAAAPRDAIPDDDVRITRDAVWCLVRPAGPGLADEAVSLLEGGARVAVISTDVAALAPLVAVHYDRILPIETDVHDSTAVDGAVRVAREHFGTIDELRTA